MNLRFLLIACGTFMFTQSQTTQNPNEQAIYKIKELAAVYAILFNSFDYREASPDFLRIDENQAEINEFAIILDNIFNELENNPIINLSRFERYDLFIGEFNKLQRSKNFEAKPIPFKVLRYHLRRFFTSLTSNTHSDFCREWKIFSETSNEQINQAINQITSLDNIDRENTNFKNLPSGLFVHPKYKDGQKSLSVSHIIGKNIMNQFQKYSDEIIASHRREMNGFDYDRIRDHTRRKMMYPHIRYLYNKYNPKDDIETGTFTRIDVDKNFLDFVRRMYLQPPGLMFLGPSQDERIDDPNRINGKKKDKVNLQQWYRERYGDYDEDFEYGCKAIVGSEYLDKVIELYKKIRAYNDDVNIRTLENTEELKNEIENIHIYRERPVLNDFEAMFFGWYPEEEWNYGTIKLDKKSYQGWYIKTSEEIINDENRPGTSGYRQTTTVKTTTSMATTTEDILLELLGNLQVDDRFKYLRDEFRKKRHYEEESECYQEKTPSNGFFCSSFYLRINPMQYFLCKWTGHKDLHFFW